MKVLTLHQPWASLIALGVKSIETRSWSTRYRGPLAIHAAARRPSQVQGVGGFCCVEGASGFDLCDYNRYEGRPLPADAVTVLPLGAIVATCTLVDVVPIYGPFGSQDVPVCVRVGGPWGEGDAPGRATISRLDNAPAFTDVGDQLPYGDFTPRRYAWLLADIVPVDPPVPFKGGQGLTKTWEPVAA